MPRCPVCGQALPEAIDQNELQARIERLTSPALAAERKRLQQEFDNRLVAQRKAARKEVERELQRELREARKRVERAEDDKRRQSQRLEKQYEARLAAVSQGAEKDVARTIRLATRESEAKFEKVQTDREREKVRHQAELAALQGKLDDLSRKLEKQTGEQLGAEAQLDLFTELRQAFPGDRIEYIHRGVKGADIVQHIMDGTKSAGRIVYESKNTSSWQNGFIIQAKKYQTQYETPHVMIVTHAFPSKQKDLCVVRSMPVVDKRMAVALATIIRVGVIAIARSRASGAARDEKSQELFEYIVGDKFGTRFQEIAEGVIALREQQQKERTWHENAWQTESKIHERIEGRHREVDAQIRAIVRGSVEGKVLKLAASAQ